ncbi:AMP-binding protein [Streptomyces sp. VRA16 Mangrove soil]|uniref:AMP-binding enzyme n=1 Tax=Streptomyces sp. VRA16 Mangrove soil TaxID=2817434 RepID=UPI001A9F1BE1|nr:AMP-binding protein [Streptomyces sp. VRA16 Mangrove soil]MBO1332597.1 AMP-binding protein [Streptomyces sp. VRA16 Mangrove soil]
MTGVTNTALWPASYDNPADLADVEAVPLDARASPASTYAVLRRAAELWPEQPALTVLPRAAQWREGSTRTFAQLRDEVHRLAHQFRTQGAGKGRAVGLLSPHTADLPAAVGRRLPYQQAKSVRVDDDGTWHDLPPGEVGDLALRGPTVFAGYVTGQGSAGPVLDDLGAVRDGWLATGDLARVDADGFIHLTGRAKDLIIRGGHNIDPAVIEDALLQHPQVSGASAAGRPDRHAGEVPVAYVTLAPGASVSPAELIAHCHQLIHEPAAVPKDITIVETLPLTDVVKPTKIPLRLRALQDVVLAELATAEVPADVGEVDCVLADDGLTVRVPYAADPSARAGIAAVLDRYAFHWEFTPAGAPTA